uniref:Reverse transcriptase domain-containing protein n=1 Tax=Tanacetum cinerariifolium TaxID=118510 RepID=A0A6L2M7Y8_TANCI|nr:hypothetical protein [Tanacetum cinerariifolium]
MDYNHLDAVFSASPQLLLRQPLPESATSPPQELLEQTSSAATPLPTELDPHQSTKDLAKGFDTSSKTTNKTAKRKLFEDTEHEINDRMAEMFGLLKELTASRTPEKVLVREEARHPITKHVNSISLIKMEEEKSVENNEVVDKNVVGPNESDVVDPIERKHIQRNPQEEYNQKRGYGGKVVISCNVGGLKYVDALVDQGSYVNVMTLSIYNRLTNEKLVGTDIRLSLTSHSYIYPLGIAEDVLVEIVGYIYLVDFVILDIKEDKKKPFILGTSFLTMAKAEISFDKGTITLKYGKNEINLFKIPESLCRAEEQNRE